MKTLFQTQIILALRKLACVGLAAVLAMISLTASADYASTLSGLGPLGYWRLNEPTQPIVPTYPLTNTSPAGATLNGLYYGVPTLQAPGAVAGDAAASFNGNLQYAESPYAAALNPSGPFTVEFWANITNDTAGAKSGVVSRYITVPGGPTAQRGYLFFANNGNTTWQFRVYNGTAATTITDANTVDIAANTWYHVVGVYDGANIHIYVNGVPTSTTSGIVVYAPNTNSPTRIGAGTTEVAPSLFFPGALDNVAIYNSVLTASQIAAHYDAATTNAAGYNAQILADSPAAYYPMNEPATPPYVPYAATNNGSLGSAQDGVYSLAGSTSGVAGPLRGQFAGFEADNKAVALNGTSGLISIPGFATSTDTVTITGWIKRNGSQVNASPILLQRAAGSPATGLVVDFNNRLGYVWNDAAATYNFNPGADFFIPDGVWTFAALSVSPTETTIYIGSTNGLKSVTHTNAISPHDFSGGPLQIGRDGTSGTRLIKGNLDEVALFGTALDAASISNLFYSAAPSIPLVTRTPANPIYEGVNVTFTASAVSSAPVNYQWRRNGGNIGANSPTLTLNNVTPGGHDGNYDVVVTAGSQSVTSVVDIITVVSGPPVILTQPVPATRFVGGSVTFSVVAGGTSPFSYQWYKGTTQITDATNASYGIAPIASGDAGNYWVRVTNPNGNLASSTNALTVLTLPSSYGGVVMQGNPNAYWNLNETSGNTAFDYAGGLHGTFPNTPTVVPGVIGPRTPAYAGFDAGNTAYQLDGTAGWVTCPALNWNTNTVTFTAWVNLTGYDDNLSGVVFARGASASGIHIGNTGELGYHWDDGGWDFGSGLTVPLNEWTFLALVVEPNQATLYMGNSNGLFSAINSSTHNPAALADPLYLGRDRTDRPLVGVIDEVTVSKRSLTLSEINTLFAVGSGVPLQLQVVPGGIIEDSKPVGTLRHGVNKATTWVATSTDSAGIPVTRTGVEQFATANSSQITITANPDFDSATGTFAFWMRANAPVPGPGDEAAILMDRRTTNGTVIALDDAGAIFVQCAGGANSLATGYLPDNNWHHVAVTYDQSLTGVIEIYVDGALALSQVNTTNWSWPTTQQIELGRSHDGYWKRYDGQMDDFRIYNRVLTAGEVASIHASDALVDTTALKLRYNFGTAGIGNSIIWPYGTLLSSPVVGPGAVWTPVSGATAPSYPFLPTDPALFFRATP